MSNPIWNHLKDSRIIWTYPSSDIQAIEAWIRVMRPWRRTSFFLTSSISWIREEAYLDLCYGLQWKCRAFLSWWTTCVGWSIDNSAMTCLLPFRAVQPVWMVTLKRFRAPTTAAEILYSHLKTLGLEYRQRSANGKGSTIMLGKGSSALRVSSVRPWVEFCRQVLSREIVFVV